MIKWLINALKSLLCCISSSPLIEGENIPEIDPKSLSSSDPFRNLVFVSNRGQLVFREKEAFVKTSELFKILGTTSYYSWIANGISLWKRESGLIGFKTPPLVFLYFILLNKVKTSYIVHFKAQSSWFWNQFLSRLGTDIAKIQDQLPELLPGFCKALSLDTQMAQKLVQGKKWQELIGYIIESRRDHFNL